MMLRNIAVVTCASLMVTACASSYTATPLPMAGQTVRYVQGQPTTVAQGRTASIQITPLGLNEAGRLTYAVAAFNNASIGTNFGVENIRAAADEEAVRIYTAAELARQAKNQATWAAVAVALSGATAAYAASSTPTSTSTTYTPYGTYHTQTTNRALQSAMVATAAAGTAYSMKEIGDNLEDTLVRLQNEILQTTTIDPNSSYGGQIVTEKVRAPSSEPLDTAIYIDWNGENFEFRWRITKDQ